MGGAAFDSRLEVFSGILYNELIPVRGAYSVCKRCVFMKFLRKLPAFAAGALSMLLALCLVSPAFAALANRSEKQ